MFEMGLFIQVTSSRSKANMLTSTGFSTRSTLLLKLNLTLEVTRQPGLMDGSKGYIAYPGEVTYHTFTGGAFDINLTAPPVTNDYTYTFRLCPYDATGGDGGSNGECGNDIEGLPFGAVDTTAAICSSSSTYGCQTFNLKIDGTAPRVVSNTWTLKNGKGDGGVLSNVLPTSNFPLRRCRSNY